VIVDILYGPAPVPECRTAYAAKHAEMVGYGTHFREGGRRLSRNRGEMLRDAQERRAKALAECPDPVQFAAMLDGAGVDKVVVTGTADPFSTEPNVVPQALAEFCRTDPDRYYGYYWIDPFDGDSANQVDYLVKELGISHIGLGHSSLTRGITSDHPLMARIYGRCEQLGVPVSLGSAINWYTKVPYDTFHPRYIDKVASAFPDLKILACHAGWPWISDMVMVAWRHENVYIDLSTHRPGQFTNPAMGWAPLLHFGDRALADRVVFGSSSHHAGADLGSLINEVRNLPLRDKTIDKWLGLNALTLLER
jgi:uncharacterized protein